MENIENFEWKTTLKRLPANMVQFKIRGDSAFLARDFRDANCDFENTFCEVVLICQQENAIFYCNHERK